MADEQAANAPKPKTRQEWLDAPPEVWAKALGIPLEDAEFFRSIERGEVTGDVLYDGEPIGRGDGNA